MKIVDRILKLRERQLVNDNIKPILHLKRERFWELFIETQKMTRPAFSMPQEVWDFWIHKIMPKFVSGNDLLVLGYRIKMI